MSLEKAKKIGALALFNEKYGDTVRVVSMGLKDDKYRSIELCGGTHAKRTGDIGSFKIQKTESVASGIRRIVACNGMNAIEFDRLLLYKANKEKESLSAEIKELKKQLDEKSKFSGVAFEEKDFDGVKFLFKNLKDTVIDLKKLKQYIIGQRDTKYNLNTIIVVALHSNKSKKITIMVALSENLTNKYDAIDILKKLGSSGGGVANFTMGGGVADFAMDSINNIVNFEPVYKVIFDRE